MQVMVPVYFQEGMFGQITSMVLPYLSIFMQWNLLCRKLIIYCLDESLALNFDAIDTRTIYP